MTPDELFTRVHRQRADLAAVELAMDALMGVLTPDQRQQWLAALRSLQAKRTQVVKKAGADPISIGQSNDAIDRRIARLTAAGAESSGGGG